MSTTDQYHYVDYGSENKATQPRLGNSQEIMDIQNQIEVYTKKIEHEKINLKLVNERYANQFELLLKLQNKKRPQKKKRSKSKVRVSVAVQPKVVKESYLDNPHQLVKEVDKKAYDSEIVIVFFKFYFHLFLKK